MQKEGRNEKTLQDSDPGQGRPPGDDVTTMKELKESANMGPKAGNKEKMGFRKD